MRPDGAEPNEVERERLVSAFEGCGVKEWELCIINNCLCIDPILGIPEASRLHIVNEVDR